MMEQTTARLRKTFQYKNEDDDDDDDSLPEALDEEEQESLIQALHTRNALRNTQYKTAFLALPLLSTLVYLPPLSRPSTAVLSTLSITSLLASAYVLYFLPGLPPLPWASDGSEPARMGVSSGTARRTAGPVGARVGMEKGPLELYLPYLNAVLAALLALAGFVGQQRAREGEDMWFALLPGLVFGVVVMAKGIMESVDVGELEGLKYGYKGA